MSGFDYDKHRHILGIEKAKHVLVIKRYDNNDGIYAAQVSFWPEKVEINDMAPSFHVLGILEDHEAFRQDLAEHGFTCREYADVHEGFQAEIVRQAVPLEWKRGMDHLGVRIQVYSSTLVR